MYEVMFVDVPEVEAPAKPSIFDLPVAPEVKPKLSDAILQHTHPQGRWHMAKRLLDGEGIATCALGAAIGVIGGDDLLVGMVTPGAMGDSLMRGSDLLGSGFSCDLRSSVVRNPVNGLELTVEYVVAYLNDQEGWTYEQIAAWLVSIGL